MFSIARLELARKRRRLTGKSLAEKAGISPVTLSRIIKEKNEPEKETIERLATALEYSADFFFLDEPDELDPAAVSFRSLSSMTARERDAAVSAGILAFEFSEWINERFNMPEPDLPDCSKHSDPEAAARLVRESWGIGEKPIGNLLKLLEAKGVRIFSLTEDTKNVDAFSYWRNDQPYIFLNTFKTAERSRFDAAHELGHLVMHRHGGPAGRRAEAEADRFAGSFLMPSVDVLSTIGPVRSLKDVIRHKKRWGVSAAALTYRLNKMGLISDWLSRGFYIRLKQDYKNTEPETGKHERSFVLEKVLTELWKEGVTQDQVSDELKIPVDEMNALLFGLVGDRPAFPKIRPNFKLTAVN